MTSGHSRGCRRIPFCWRSIIPHQILDMGRCATTIDAEEVGSSGHGNIGHIRVSAPSGSLESRYQSNCPHQRLGATSASEDRSSGKRYNT